MSGGRLLPRGGGHSLLERINKGLTPSYVAAAGPPPVNWASGGTDSDSSGDSDVVGRAVGRGGAGASSAPASVGLKRLRKAGDAPPPPPAAGSGGWLNARRPAAASAASAASAAAVGAQSAGASKSRPQRCGARKTYAAEDGDDSDGSDEDDDDDEDEDEDEDGARPAAKSRKPPPPKRRRRQAGSDEDCDEGGGKKRAPRRRADEEEEEEEVDEEDGDSDDDDGGQSSGSGFGSGSDEEGGGGGGGGGSDDSDASGARRRARARQGSGGGGRGRPSAAAVAAHAAGAAVVDDDDDVVMPAARALRGGVRAVAPAAARRQRDSDDNDDAEGGGGGAVDEAADAEAQARSDIRGLLRMLDAHPTSRRRFWRMYTRACDIHAQLTGALTSAGDSGEGGGDDGAATGAGELGGAAAPSAHLITAAGLARACGWAVPQAASPAPRRQPSAAVVAAAAPPPPPSPSPSPSPLSLRPFQLVGVNFLHLLHRQGHGCILADEMGLGKTVQVAAFLGHLAATASVDAAAAAAAAAGAAAAAAAASGSLSLRARVAQAVVGSAAAGSPAGGGGLPGAGPHLVVVPASLLANWQLELAKWAPRLRVGIYRGGQSRFVQQRQLLHGVKPVGAARRGGAATGVIELGSSSDDGGTGRAGDGADAEDNVEGGEASGSDDDEEEEDEDEEGEGEDEELEDEEADDDDDGAVVAARNPVAARAFDILLVTYTMFDKTGAGATTDRKFLKRFEWDVLVLDEGHAIRDETRNRNRYLRSLRTRMRLLLSGTPVQNNIGQLFALLRFVMPAVFSRGAQLVFEEAVGAGVAGGDGGGTGASGRGRGGKPPSRARLTDQSETGDAAAAEGGMDASLVGQLRRVLAPFMLRRSKAEVLKSLPAKTDSLLLVRPTAVQSGVYDALLAQARARLLGGIAGGAAAGVVGGQAAAAGDDGPMVIDLDEVEAGAAGAVASTGAGGGSAEDGARGRRAAAVKADAAIARRGADPPPLRGTASAPASTQAGGSGQGSGAAGGIDQPAGGKRSSALAATSAAGVKVGAANSLSRYFGGAAAPARSSAPASAPATAPAVIRLDVDSSPGQPETTPAARRWKRGGDADDEILDDAGCAGSAAATAAVAEAAADADASRNGLPRRTAALAAASAIAAGSPRGVTSPSRRRAQSVSPRRPAAADGSTPQPVAPSNDADAGGEEPLLPAPASAPRRSAAAQLSSAVARGARPVVFTAITPWTEEKTSPRVAEPGSAPREPAEGLRTSRALDLTGEDGYCGAAGAAAGAAADAAADAGAQLAAVVDAASAAAPLAPVDARVKRAVASAAKMEVRHLFTDLRKAASHPLLLRIWYTHAPSLRAIGTALMRGGAFGTHATLTLARVVEELEGSSDFAIHTLCCEYGGRTGLVDDLAGGGGGSGGGGGGSGGGGGGGAAGALPRTIVAPPGLSGPKLLSACRLPASSLLAGGKAAHLAARLPGLLVDGHRVLIFSGWTSVLDILEPLLSQVLGVAYLRLDGSTPVNDRQALITEFNAPDSPYGVFLLSTRAGGLGLNLTGADTVVIHDVSFNPQDDAQAVDRAHRLGQTRPVTVLRLVTAGTVDEAIYRLAAGKTALDTALKGGGKGVGGEDGGVPAASIAELLARALA